MVLTPCSLRGHRDQITAIRFLAVDLPSVASSSTSTPGLLLTGSKDTFLKLWDLSTQHCVQTIVAHRAEVWTLDVNKEQGLVFTGSNEGELKAWSIDHDAIAEGATIRARRIRTLFYLILNFMSIIVKLIVTLFTGSQSNLLFMFTERRELARSVYEVVHNLKLLLFCLFFLALLYLKEYQLL